MKEHDHIHPVFDRLMSRSEKEAFLKQKAKVIWLTGLSGAGKSTLAAGLEKGLAGLGYFTKVLDGDNVRKGINNNLGFSEEDRMENIRRIAEVSKLFKDSGIITINSFVSPTIAIRNLAKDIIGNEDFIEVYVNAPIQVCEERDVKGLYKKARAGEIKDFTGISSPFEAPVNPNLEIKTAEQSIEESVSKLIDFIIPFLKIN